ncbi:MAG TPA: hypothetical protein VF163_11210 [Micromonosporaceae bacterium]
MTMPDEVAPEDREPVEDLVPAERDIEAPDADAVEQATPADPRLARAELRRGLEVSEYDALEQSVVVDLEDDDYR